MADAIPNPNFREVPGYREFLRRESEIRDNAFLPDFTQIAGIPVYRMTPWHLNALTAVRNGFVVPCIFDDELERAEHAMQLIWCVSRAYRMPGENESWRKRLKLAVSKSVLAHRIAKASAERVYGDIAEYLEEAFYDAPKSPKGAETGYRAPLHTSWLAIVLDDLAGGGYAMSADDVMQTPLSRLWQLHRRAQRRLYPKAVTLTSPSDVYFQEHMNDPMPAREAKS